MSPLNIERLMQRLQTLAEIGVDAHGGITRLAFTEADIHARTQVQRWMEQAGLRVHTDAVGNLCGRTADWQENSPGIMCGSHIDTVRQAGAFDGTLGVLAAIEVADFMNREGATWRRSLEVVAFAMEESSRFQCYGFGSKAMAGLPLSDTILQNRDESGITLTAALSAYHHRDDDDDAAMMQHARQAIAAAARHPGGVHAFVELHIEQGPVLAARQLGIGLVTAIAAPLRLAIRIEGMQNHTGTTPMTMRHDALTAAAEVILCVESLCRDHPQVRGTVATIHNQPNTINTIPGSVCLGVDLRSSDITARHQLHLALSNSMQGIAKRRGVTIASRVITEDQPVTMSPALLQVMESHTEDAGIPCCRIESGAGHDAASIACIANHCGMIFVASDSGISHHPDECSDEGDIQQGLVVLHRTIASLRND